jgi:hypothetical protein
MFYSGMSLNRTIRGFALLLALMLPLQSYAATPACARSPVLESAAPHHCAGERAAAHGDHSAGERAAFHGNHSAGGFASHTNHCGDCCGGTAIALTPLQWSAPRLAAPESSRAILWSPPTVTADRLDRPPRFILA